MMKLLAFGGDERMTGAVCAARRAGWEATHIRDTGGEGEAYAADAVLLPWPHSFKEDQLAGAPLTREQALSMIPPCRCVMHGAGIQSDMLPMALSAVNPAQDEAFLQANAELTAEGAIYRAMARQGRALMGSTCVVTGFGRIGMALTKRLAALRAFVIVCARNEKQMQRAHELGAHPMHISRMAAACAQADVVFNTIPARVLHESALLALGRDALVVELASAPYGLDMELASRLGVMVALESGVPGRYAPMDAGAALFDALQRAMTERKGEDTDG